LRTILHCETGDGIALPVIDVTHPAFALTMTDADMRLIDADPKDPFDFFPDHYNDQLVAGYSKTTASGGLLVYMPDYDKVSKPLTPR